MPRRSPIRTSRYAPLAVFPTRSRCVAAKPERRGSQKVPEPAGRIGIIGEAIDEVAPVRQTNLIGAHPGRSQLLHSRRPSPAPSVVRVEANGDLLRRDFAQRGYEPLTREADSRHGDDC
jgi:hypothetical protein